MDIRPVAPPDLEELSRVYVAAYDDGWTVAQARKYLEKFYGFEPSSCLVARDEAGGIVGAIFAYSYARKDEPVLFIQELFVHPRARNRGIGRALVAAVREAVSPREVKITPLVNAAPNVLRFYNSLGFNREQAFTFWE